MEWTIIIVAILLGLAIGFFFIFRRESKKSYTLVSEAELVEQMRKGQLVDIRKKEQFEEGHINGARNIPAAVLTRQPGRLRRDLPVYLVCENGKGCKRAALLLYSKGYENIYTLEGGMSSWTGALKKAKK